MTDVKDGKLSDITPDANNANQGTERGRAALESSLRKYGAGRSILLDRAGRIISGNKTAEEAGQIGLDDVIIVKTDGKQLVAVQREDLDLSDDSTGARELAYSDNRVGELDLSWNPETILGDLEAGVDLSGLFRGDELSEILGELGRNGQVEDVEPQIDKAAELQAKWGTATGQIWELDEHRLVCGDCTDRAVVESVMRGEKSDIEIHDPPYGISLDTDWSSAKSRLDFAAENPFFGGKKHRPVEGDFADYDPSFLFNRDKTPKEMFLWGADYYAEKIPNRNSGSWLIWDKRLDEAGDRMYGSSFETCWSLSKHKRDLIRVKWAGIFGTEQEPDRKRLHPTQKPVLLYEWLLNRYSKVGDISGDFYLGAGSHLIACEQLSRKCRGIEIDPGYVGVTLERWHTMAGKDPVLTNA